MELPHTHLNSFGTHDTPLATEEAPRLEVFTFRRTSSVQVVRPIKYGDEGAKFFQAAALGLDNLSISKTRLMEPSWA